MNNDTTISVYALILGLLVGWFIVSPLLTRLFGI